MGKIYKPKKLPSGVSKKSMQRRHSEHMQGAKQRQNNEAPEPTTPASSSAVKPKFNRFDKSSIIGIKAAFYVLFFIIFNHLAFSLAEKFLHLASMVGFTLSHMSVTSVPKLLRAAARFYRNQLIQSINADNNDKIALMLDESTDVNSNKTLIVILRMLRNNKPVELFLDNMVLLDTTAEGISKTLLDGLRTLGADTELLKRKLVSIGTDGASVMRGRLNGLHMQLQRAGFSKIISVHCFAH